ncbi:hypothetical protein [Nocardia sp. NPDC004604]|uniref:primosomal protein N' family DNA-binding protein n=1 Tax=Nocardia sp. NPDC004604 TaxID=3157013 RepID=UPI0033B30E55
MATHDSTTAGHPIARVLPLLSPAHLDRDFDYLVPPELDELAQPGVRVRVRFAGRLVDGYILARLSHSDHTGKMVKLERVVSAERVLTPEILRLATSVAARYAGTRADVLRLAIPPRHARTENGGPKKSAESQEPQQDSATPPRRAVESSTLRAPLDSELVDDPAAEPTAAVPDAPSAAARRDAPLGADPQRASSGSGSPEAAGTDFAPSAVGVDAPAAVTDSLDATPKADGGGASAGAIDSAAAVNAVAALTDSPDAPVSGSVPGAPRTDSGVGVDAAAAVGDSFDARPMGDTVGARADVSEPVAQVNVMAAQAGSPEAPALGAAGTDSAEEVDAAVGVGDSFEGGSAADAGGVSANASESAASVNAVVALTGSPVASVSGPASGVAAVGSAVEALGVDAAVGVGDSFEGRSAADGEGAPADVSESVAAVNVVAARADSPDAPVAGGPVSGVAATDSADSAERVDAAAVGAESFDASLAADAVGAADGVELAMPVNAVVAVTDSADAPVAGGRKAPSTHHSSDTAVGTTMGSSAEPDVQGAGACRESGGPSGAVAVNLDAWGRYVHGRPFVGALGQGKGVRAGWQAVPGEDWARRLAELAAVVAGRGRSAILMVPDQRDLDRVLAECVRLVGDSAVGLAAGLGPAARYRRWLAALRGSARVIVGTRSAVFAPAHDLGLIAIWDDGDDTYAEPRAPYPHAREVAMLRAHETGAAFVAGGFARTAEIQAVVDSGWAHDLIADRAVVRKLSPRISAPGDSDIAMERDPVARAVRIPAVGYAAARSALKEGVAVLVQVPRRGYIPALACAKCRTPARCRHCNGPLALPDGRAGHRGETAHSPACRWCGITEAAFRCPACASRALRAVVIGAARTAEELGRAFPGVPIRGSSGGAILDTVEPGPQVIVATVGAEPVLPGGYGVALLLDGWALLSRADLRAAEDTLRRWMSAAALVRNHGQVIVMAEPSLPTVQALLRWDPVGHARAELASRAEVGFPPAVRMAAIDGTSDSIAELLSAAKLPDSVDRLGPVPLPPGARKPFDSGDSPAEVERMLLRVNRASGAALARALTAAQAIRSTHRSDAPLRVQIDPVDIG